jgi:replicative DNA helicase
MSDRVAPHDLTAERAVLGAVLLEPEMFDVAEAAGLRAVHFFRTAHRQVWESFARVRGAGQPIDPLLVRADLAHAGTLEDVGGLVFLASLTDGVPRAMNVEGYARLVRQHAQRRDLIAVASQTVADAYDGGELDELLDRAESRLMAVGRDATRGEFVLASDWMSEMFAAVERASADKRTVTGVPCGLASIDHLTRGWQPADLIVIAGRPSDGKTALMMQFALEASRHAFVAVCSLEMSRLSVGWRVVALEARVDAFSLMTGHLTGPEMRRVGDAMARLAERRLAIDDAAGQSVSGLCAKVRRLTARYGAGIVFVDYLQLMHASGENRTQEITQISGRLKALAKDLNVPVVVLSQLTRDNAKGGAASRPQLHHLRDGGSIEQDADVVLMIHRPNKATDHGRFTDGEEVELILAKQRNGPANVNSKVHWHGPTMRFTDITTSHEEGAA